MNNIYTVLIVLFSVTIINAQNTGFWINREPMPTPRQEIPHTVYDDRIYIPGGIISNAFEVTDKVEVFDPSTNTWSEIKPMSAQLHHHTITEVNGKLYVVGGYLGGSFSQPQNKVYEYELQGDAWKEKAHFPFEIAAHTAAGLNGKLYVFGGVSPDGVLNTAYEYDPSIDEWKELASMEVPREHLTSAVYLESIFVIGGMNSNGNTNAVEKYNPSTDIWMPFSNLPTARSGLASASLNGKIYVFGGEIPGVFEENEELNPETGEWRTMAPMPVPRHGIGAATVNDTIFIIGGGAVAGFHQSDVNEGFVYSPETIVDDEETGEIDFKLYQNYPNPFNPGTLISWEMVKGDHILLKVFDMLGREIKVLVNEIRHAGHHSIRFNAEDLPGGVYVYTISTDIFFKTKKMILIR